MVSEQTGIYLIELASLASFVLALLLPFVFGKAKDKRAFLKKGRKWGSLTGACCPVLFFLARARSAADLGGPLFLPCVAVMGAMFGFAMGTLYSVCRHVKRWRARDKTKSSASNS
jgi:hypothetical protein